MRREKPGINEDVKPRPPDIRDEHSDETAGAGYVNKPLNVARLPLSQVLEVENSNTSHIAAPAKNLQKLSTKT